MRIVLVACPTGMLGSYSTLWTRELRCYHAFSEKRRGLLSPARNNKRNVTDHWGCSERAKITCFAQAGGFLVLSIRWSSGHLEHPDHLNVPGERVFIPADMGQRVAHAVSVSRKFHFAVFVCHVPTALLIVCV